MNILNPKQDNEACPFVLVCNLMAPIQLTYFYANFVTTAMSAFPKETGSSVQRIRLK
jgi:hypothetical protein